MAQAKLFVCGKCQKTVEAWSDGNPYYLDDAGEKRYAYHPDHENLARCIGNDTPHLCLNCGSEFVVDSRTPIEACPNCEKAEISDSYHLDGKRCPYCKDGDFAEDPDYQCVS